MIKRYRHLYKKLELGNGFIWVPHNLGGKAWFDHLTPAHRKFLESMDHVHQLVCGLSTDPFKCLKDYYEAYKRDGLLK